MAKDELLTGLVQLQSQRTQCFLPHPDDLK